METHLHRARPVLEAEVGPILHMHNHDPHTSIARCRDELSYDADWRCASKSQDISLIRDGSSLQLTHKQTNWKCMCVYYTLTYVVDSLAWKRRLWPVTHAPSSHDEEGTHVVAEPVSNST